MPLFSSPFKAPAAIVINPSFALASLLVVKQDLKYFKVFHRHDPTINRSYKMIEYNKVVTTNYTKLLIFQIDPLYPLFHQSTPTRPKTTALLAHNPFSKRTRKYCSINPFLEQSSLATMPRKIWDPAQVLSHTITLTCCANNLNGHRYHEGLPNPAEASQAVMISFMQEMLPVWVTVYEFYEWMVVYEYMEVLAKVSLCAKDAHCKERYHLHTSSVQGTLDLLRPFRHLFLRLREDNLTHLLLARLKKNLPFRRLRLLVVQYILQLHRPHPNIPKTTPI